MKQFNTLTALTCGLVLSWPSVGQAQQAGVLTVEVFANSAMHITPAPGPALPYKLNVYRVDALQNLEKSLTQALPQNEADARRWLAANQARIQREVQPQAVAAANAVALAHHYRINRLPAMVIDRKAIVYGLTDVDAAVARYKASGVASPAARSKP